LHNGNDLTFLLVATMNGIWF